MNIDQLFSVANKIVLITGGSRGYVNSLVILLERYRIGLMIARGFVCNGARVYISSRKAQVCDQVASQLSEEGLAFFIAFLIGKGLDNVSVYQSEVKRLVEELKKREDRLHILINNAGANWSESFESFSDDAFEKVIQLNLMSVFSLTRECLPLLESASSSNDPARIINIGSINGIQPPTFPTFSYSSSKAALHMLTKHLATILGHRQITVNAVAPGSFESKMMKETLDNFGDVIRAGVPLGRIGRPEDMAGVCIWLSSQAGSYVNGSVVVVDGGAVLTQQLGSKL